MKNKIVKNTIKTNMLITFKVSQLLKKAKKKKNFLTAQIRCMHKGRFNKFHCQAKNLAYL